MSTVELAARYTSEMRCVVVLGLILASVLSAQPGRRKPKKSSDSSFDYYLLAMSYAPDFCAQPSGEKDPRECGPGRKVGFIVHGLWPQRESGRGPERCSSARPVSREILQLMLNYIPTESLIQHEWANHGTCSGLNVSDYFAAIRKARDVVTIPADLKAPEQPLQFKPPDIEAKFAAANPGFPQGAFRASCYGDGELQEIRACFGADLKPRPCSASAGACHARNVKLLPVK